jgi:tetratricopeptide (TPR) repeat protein
MFDVAERYFLQSIDERKLKSPDNAFLLYSSYLQLGNCQKNSGKLHEAVASLQLALNFAERGFGSEAETLYQLASIYEMLEKWEKALNCY